MNFEKGDVINFCGENYLVIENKGNQGFVYSLDGGFRIRGFLWSIGDDTATFHRKAIPDELYRAGLVLDRETITQ
jgi:hypothetical protein